MASVCKELWFCARLNLFLTSWSSFYRVYDVVQYNHNPWFKFYFPSFLDMIRYGNEFERKGIKFKPRIKLNHNVWTQPLYRRRYITETMFLGPCSTAVLALFHQDIKRVSSTHPNINSDLDVLNVCKVLTLNAKVKSTLSQFE